MPAIYIFNIYHPISNEGCECDPLFEKHTKSKFWPAMVITLADDTADLSTWGGGTGILVEMAYGWIKTCKEFYTVTQKGTLQWSISTIKVKICETERQNQIQITLWKQNNGMHFEENNIHQYTLVSKFTNLIYKYIKIIGNHSTMVYKVKIWKSKRRTCNELVEKKVSEVVTVNKNQEFELLDMKIA